MQRAELFPQLPAITSDSKHGRSLPMILHFTGWRATISWSAVLSLAGCASRPTPPSVPASQQDRPPVTAVDSTVHPSSAPLDIYRAGSIRYDYRLTSTVQSIAGDSIPRTDSVRITAVLTATFNGDATQRVTDATLKADSIIIATQPGSTASSSLQTQFVPLRVDRSSGRITSPRAILAECTQETQDVVFHGDEIVPAVVREGSASRSWADTSTSEVCRGGLRLQLARIARYRVEASTSTQPAQTTVIRVTDVRVSGNGVQWQQPVQVSGEGSAVDTLSVGGIPPRLRQLSGQSQMELEFRSPMRTQRFLQRSATAIAARSP